jgi:hypothetical protein
MARRRRAAETTEMRKRDAGNERKLRGFFLRSPPIWRSSHVTRAAGPHCALPSPSSHARTHARTHARHPCPSSPRHPGGREAYPQPRQPLHLSSARAGVLSPPAHACPPVPTPHAARVDARSCVWLDRAGVVREAATQAPRTPKPMCRCPPPQWTRPPHPPRRRPGRAPPSPPPSWAQPSWARMKRNRPVRPWRASWAGRPRRRPRSGRLGRPRPRPCAQLPPA